MEKNHCEQKAMYVYHEATIQRDNICKDMDLVSKQNNILLKSPKQNIHVILET